MSWQGRWDDMRVLVDTFIETAEADDWVYVVRYVLLSDVP
jgi:hypothetical protein